MSSIKQGYKQTKVGIIPEDWEVVKLSSLSEKISDGIHTTPVYTDNTDFYFINGNNLVKNSIQVSEITKTVSEDEYRKHRIDLDSKTILMSINGTIGNLAIYNGEKIILGKSACYIILKNKSSLKFVYSLLQSRNTQKSFEAELTGSTIKNLSLKTIKDTFVPFPPLQEQEKIAEILTTWDEAISLHVKLIEEKEQLKIGLMQKLLSGEVRFEGFCDKWEEVKLEDIGQIITGTTPSTEIKDYYENGKYPWITPTDINHKKNISTSERYLTSLGLEKGRFIPKGSLLVTCIASIGKNAILTVDGSCNQQINAILPSEKNNTNYLYYLIEYKKDYLIKFAGQSATQILNKKSFSNLKIKIPSPQEQEKIAEVLSLADDELTLLKNELEVLKEQKKGLMQKLLTGEVRVMA